MPLGFLEKQDFALQVVCFSEIRNIGKTAPRLDLEYVHDLLW